MLLIEEPSVVKAAVNPAGTVGSTPPVKAKFVGVPVTAAGSHLKTNIWSLAEMIALYDCGIV